MTMTMRRKKSTAMFPEPRPDFFTIRLRQFQTGERCARKKLEPSLAMRGSILTRGHCQECCMYPVFQFCASDGLTLATIPVPPVDAIHAEMRVRSFCAGTSWYVVGQCQLRPEGLRPGACPGLIPVDRLPVRPKLPFTRRAVRAAPTPNPGRHCNSARHSAMTPIAIRDADLAFFVAKASISIYRPLVA